MTIMEKRVVNLEKVLAEFISSVGEAQRQTERELRDFKDEARWETRRMNERWGNIANKMGTLVEDLVAPSIPRIIKENFNREVIDTMIRRKKKLTPEKTKEYDAIAATDDRVFVNATKSTLRNNDVRDFVEDIKEFRDFFSEYKNYKLIGILASLYVNTGVLKYAERHGFMVLAVGDELMEVKNNKEFQPKLW